VQTIREMRIDDDQDCIWLRVDVAGGASCHVGYRSCFYRRVDAPVTGEPVPLALCVAVALAVCATGIYAEEARVLNALNYPLCQVLVLKTRTKNPTLVQMARERGLPGIVLHQRPNAIILGTSVSSSSLLVETLKSLPIA
jgi:hypothetical protein